MGTSLVIVESATKIKSLRKFLGSGFSFESCFGHVRDLPENEFGIDLEHNFEPNYVPLADRKTVIAKLKKAAKECDTVYLAPDPDREGEAIAWHIKELLGPKVTVQRVSFNSITKEAVLEALSQPRQIDMALVNAQQARRLLDRLVGYTLSPLMSRKLRRGGKEAVSAGRVQSVALKIVVDRERAIEAFIPKEYWNITAHVMTEIGASTFTASLYSIDGKKIDKEASQDNTCINNAIDAASVKESLEKAAPYTVIRVEKREKKRQPEAPFITSTLQQEASRHFRMSPSTTMLIAQQLYEGIDLEETSEGLITYMRTDSVRISPEAMEELRQFITHHYSKDLLFDEIRKFQVKKSAQDAHEAIRPTHVHRTPDSVRPYLTEEQFLLYSLIWKRYVASQMANAIYDTVSCDLSDNSRFILRSTGSQIKDPGFLRIYEEGHDDEEVGEEHRLLPELTPGQTILLDHVDAAQAFTRPPPRFTEATLIKELEKSGIGRPSTYASIMKKISERKYTTKEQGRLKPTELGRVVTDMLEQNFPELMNIGFTVSMEDALEEVAENHKDWRELLQTFWNPFSKAVEIAKVQATPQKITTDILCPNCNAPLQKIWFQSKYFLGCSRYPECTYSTSLEEAQFNKEDYQADFDYDQPCPKCQSKMKIRFGKYGPFLGCTQYPTCKGVVPILKKGEEPSATHPCLAVGCTGELHQRRSRFGKLFWSCSSYPDCDVIGNSIEDIVSKYQGREKTAFVAKKKTATKRTVRKPKEKSSSTKTLKKKSSTKQKKTIQ